MKKEQFFFSLTELRSVKRLEIISELKNKGMNMLNKPLVGILMGSDSDLEIMKEASEILKQFEY